MKVSDLIAEFLEKKEIKVIFGVIGSANSHIFDSIDKRGYTKIVNVHHEQAAVMAMGAYYRTCGKIAAALATAGPGAANTLTGILSCWADSVPGLIITGQESSGYFESHKNLRMMGTQGFDVARMVKKITKYSTTLHDSMLVQDELEKSYNMIFEGRFGPTLVDVPFDVQSKVVPRREWNLEQLSDVTSVSDENIEYVIECLRKAKRPVILGGHGIKLSNSKDNFIQLVSRTRIPTLLTWAAIDLLPFDNENFYGRAGVYGQRCSNFIIQNADVILVLGSRLALPQVGYDIRDFAPHSKIIVVDIDIHELHKYEKKCDKLIYGDCGEVIDKLINSMKERISNKTPWITQCKEWREKYPLLMKEHKNEKNGYLNSYAFMDKLSEYLTEDHIIVTDMGTALLSGHQAIRLKENQTMFTSTGLGEMGYGLPAAVGASFASNGREVLCMNCDGGMMMNIQELQTIIHYELPVKILVFNNDGYLMIKQTQNLLFNGKFVSSNKETGISLPDYSKIAIAFGFESYTLNSWTDFDKTIMQFLNSRSPSICEVAMDPLQEFIPKARGVLGEDNTIITPLLEEMSPLLPLETIQEEMIAGLNDKSLRIKR